MLGEGNPIALLLLAVAQVLVPHADAADAPARPVLELEVRAGGFPAVVLAADEGERGHADGESRQRPLDPKTRRVDRRDVVPRAIHERDLMPRAREVRADGAADRARAPDEESHLTPSPIRRAVGFSAH